MTGIRPAFPPMARRLGFVMVLAVGLIGAVGLTGGAAAAGPADGPPMPAADDTCPVCGMFVAKYPEWIATITFADGHAHHFDGAKDMFKFLGDMGRYDQRHAPDQVTGVFVTEYYGLTRIPAGDAIFVIGSDVLGPMGHEFVPCASREDADAFVKDHGGVAILAYDQVTPGIIKDVDQGDFSDLEP